MTVQVWHHDRPLRLRQKDYVGQGGQGTVYALGKTAYKVYSRPDHAISTAKIAELNPICDNNVIKPLSLLLDANSNPAGYTMRYVGQAYTLCQLFPKSFRERQGLSPQHMFTLVQQLQNSVDNVHRAGVLVVDLNELNFLVSHNFQELYCIDVDSYQTRSFPANAIMESIRDRQTTPGKFSEKTDWFAFAIVSFQMLVGIHPYKGKHPSVQGLSQRMKKNLSVFDPQVTLPHSVYPLSHIPAHYLDWYRAVLNEGQRCAPPTGSAKIDLVHSSPPPAFSPQTTGSRVKLQQRHTFDAAITGLWTAGRHTVVATQKGLWLDQVAVTDEFDVVTGVALAKGMARPVAALLRQQQLCLFDLQQRQPIPHSFLSQHTMVQGGSVYCLLASSVVELVQMQTPETTVVAGRTACQSTPHSSRLFPGVLLQELLGSVFVTLFHGGCARQLPLVELDGYRILEAKFERGVLMVIAYRDGQNDRLVFRFGTDSKAWASKNNYDVRVVSDVGHCGLNFVVLGKGLCVCLNEAEQLELFLPDPGNRRVDLVEDSQLSGDMVLCRSAGQVLFYRGNKVYSMRLER